MEIRGWEERYRSHERPAEDYAVAPVPLVAETAKRLRPGRVLDLACGTGRNALWLAKQGWRVTAVDGAPTAIEVLRRRAREDGVALDARVADLEQGEYRIEPAAWDLICVCYYLQRGLFETAKQGLAPGGVLIAIVHITEAGEEPTPHRLRPGELETYFREWEILHRYEGQPNDTAHKRLVAEIVARRPDERA
jgi:SAM-dependent methyltransferase